MPRQKAPTPTQEPPETDWPPEDRSLTDQDTPTTKALKSVNASNETKNASALRSQLEAIPRLIQTNMALLEQKYDSIVTLQNQQLEQVKQIVAQLNALFQVAEEFLSNVDETTDKLIEETAAIVQLRADLAAEALAETNSPGASNGTTPTQG